MVALAAVLPGDPIPPGHLGQLLRQARIRRGMRLQGASEQTEIPRCRLLAYERGEERVPPAVYARLQQVYGPIVPPRVPIEVVDGRITIDGRSLIVVARTTDAVLNGYLQIVASMRGVRRGRPMLLRAADRAVLAEALGLTRSHVETRLMLRMHSLREDPSHPLHDRRWFVPAVAVAGAAAIVATTLAVRDVVDVNDGSSASGTAPSADSPTPVASGQGGGDRGGSDAAEQPATPETIAAVPGTGAASAPERHGSAPTAPSAGAVAAAAPAAAAPGTPATPTTTPAAPITAPPPPATAPGTTVPATAPPSSVPPATDPPATTTPDLPPATDAPATTAPGPPPLAPLQGPLEVVLQVVTSIASLVDGVLHPL